jgi:uncharacterized protein (DUF924 family)
MSFSWDCYRETLFEQELWMLDHLPPKTYQESERDIIHRFGRTSKRNQKEI